VQVHEALAPDPRTSCSGAPSRRRIVREQLYPVLRQLGRSTMLMTGVSTNLAVEGIVRASVNRGFDVVVVEDCCASYPDEWHRFSIDNIMPLLATVTSSDAVLAALRAG
jgi:nicotinamidase-related amidase